MKRRKIMIVLLTFYMVIWSLVSDIHCQEVFEIGSGSFPPYQIPLADGKLTGINIEILEHVLPTINFPRYKIKSYPFARLLVMFTNYRLKAMFLLRKTPERESLYYFPDEPLVQSKWFFFIRREDQGKLQYRSFDDLRGKRVGVVRGYTYPPEFWVFLKQEQNYEEVAVDEMNLKKLVAGRFDFALCEYGAGMYLAKKLGILPQIVALTEKSLFESPLYIAFNKNAVDQEMVKKFSTALKAFKSGPEYQSIVNKYIGE